MAVNIASCKENNPGFNSLLIHTAITTFKTQLQWKEASLSSLKRSNLTSNLALFFFIELICLKF